MKKILLLFLLLFILSSKEFANQIHIVQFNTVKQKNNDKNYIIEGFVYDSTAKVGIPSASVFLKGHLNKNCITNSNGHFKLLLPLKYSKKNFILVSACVGYKEEKVKVINKGTATNKNLVFILYAAKYDLDEVVQTCCMN